MSRLTTWLVCYLVIMLAVSACVTSEDPTGVSSPLSLSSPLAAEKSTPEAKEMSKEERQAVTDAEQALVEQMKVSVDQIEVMSVESVQFGDTSLGCPQPGMVYAQMITPGYKVILRLDGQTYDYRISGQQTLVCESDAAKESAKDDKDAAGSENEQTQAVEAAINALAGEMKVSADEIEDEIEVISVARVQFRDSSLGCPQPGMAYLQVITPGYQVLLRLDGQTFDYRISGQQTILCEGNLPTEKSEADTETTDLIESQTEAAEAAVKVLAEQMKVSVDQIELVSVEAVQFSDTSLGCPQPGMMYAQVITPGYKVILSLDGQDYDYRVSGRQTVLCPADK